MTKIVSLSGYEGAGKTTLLSDVAANVPNLFVVPEVARLLLPITSSLMQRSAVDVSYSTFAAYLSALHIIGANDIQSALFDRNIIDSLVYLQLFNPGRVMPLQEVNVQLQRFLDDHKRDYLFDVVVLLKHPSDHDFIEHVVMADKQRLYSSSVNEYLALAKEWERTYYATYSQLDRIAGRFMYVDCYPTNPGLRQEVADLFKVQGVL